jgi:hypothetical protein
MALISSAQKQYAFDPRISLSVFSALEQFYNMVCGNPPLVDLASLIGLPEKANGVNRFGDSELKVGKYLKMTGSGHTALFVGFDFELGKNPKYEDYIFGVSICKKDLKEKYQDEAGKSNFDVLERADDWITVRLDPDISMRNTQAFESEVIKIVDTLLKK